MKSPTVLKALHGNLLLFIKVMKVNVNAQQAVWAFKCSYQHIILLSEKR